MACSILGRLLGLGLPTTSSCRTRRPPVEHGSTNRLLVALISGWPCHRRRLRDMLLGQQSARYKPVKQVRHGSSEKRNEELSLPNATMSNSRHPAPFVREDLHFRREGNVTNRDAGTSLQNATLRPRCSRGELFSEERIGRGVYLHLKAAEQLGKVSLIIVLTRKTGPVESGNVVALKDFCSTAAKAASPTAKSSETSRKTLLKVQHGQYL
jgi:hypothetical protein